MSEKGPNAKTDPELVRQLEIAAESKKPVEAVFILRSDDPSQIVPAPERTEELTREILKRVKKRARSSEHRYNVFRNLGSFVVSAPPTFLRELMLQPEIAAAMANQQPGEESVEPVKKRPAPSARRHHAGGAQRKAKAGSMRNKTARAKPGE